ncbi:Mucin-1 [Holothuria leucospilota]|uniref:Mucin-1 n=1 Tax=Holothuria leucospilota TaxID=206669 RepID=A0A9Q1BCL6_HOLLE|nr:Mucin-1 [Holothuria leucospilota]
MDFNQDSDEPRPTDSMGDPDIPMSTFQPFIRRPEVEGTVHESENELEDVDPPEANPSTQAEDTEAPAAEEFPPPPPESMAMENEPEEVAEGDSAPLVNEEADPHSKVIVSNSDHDDDGIEIHEVPDPQPPEPAQENASNRPGQSLAYAPSVRARYVDTHVPYDNEEKEMYTKFCWACVCLILLTSIVGFLLAVALVTNLDPELSSANVTEGSAGEGDMVLAEVMVTLDLNFTDYLYDPSSSQYKELEADYLEWLQQIFRETSFAGDVLGAFVNGFRPGSVIVHSSVLFILSDNSLTNIESNLANELSSAVEEQETSITLPIEAVTVGEVILHSEDTKRPIEVFVISPRPQTSQATVTQGISSTQTVGASNSTTSPSSSLSQSLGTSTTSLPATSLGTGMTSSGMEVTSTATRGKNLTTTDTPSSNVTTPVTTI